MKQDTVLEVKNLQTFFIRVRESLKLWTVFPLHFKRRNTGHCRRIWLWEIHDFPITTSISPFTPWQNC